MLRHMLKSKIHRATVTEANLHYEGSITIDRTLMEAADLLPYEQVHVLDVNNGSRFETYVITGDANSGTICVNGAAARLVHAGDLILILSYQLLSDEHAHDYEPRVILVDGANRILPPKA